MVMTGIFSSFLQLAIEMRNIAIKTLKMLNLFMIKKLRLKK